jgi:hypothetical protein
MNPGRVGVHDAVAGEPVLTECGVVVQLGVQVEQLAGGQRLAPQLLVVATKGLAVTVRVPTAGVAAHIETGVDQAGADHAETLRARPHSLGCGTVLESASRNRAVPW